MNKQSKDNLIVKSARALAKYVRLSPDKGRRVVNLVRNKDVNEALDILRVVSQNASVPVNKVIYSAKSNAINNHGMDENKLFISKIIVNEGPRYYKFQPKARGRIFKIARRYSHLTVEVSERK